jgi:GrpB-like predicted nucleotidyltransferase (UPF0157 family)
MTPEINEPVHVIDYDARWPAWFAEDVTELSQALGCRLHEAQHFGSTAVPGMAAKPIIDILVAPIEWPLAAPDRDTLESLGYEYLGEAGVPGREYFRRRRAHDTNLAVVRYGSALWHDNLLLRDFLRVHDAQAAAYSAAKRDGWRAGATTLLAYSKAKAPIVDTLLTAAHAWRPTNQGLRR